MLDWAEPTTLAPGCACELLPLAADGNANADPQPTTAVAVRPGDDARVFRLLQPSARLACSPECGRVTIASVDDNREWVLPEEEGLVVRRLEGEGSSPASCGGAAVAGFPWSGGEGTTTLLHALILRAEATNASTTKPSQSLIPRAAALLLFLGLNVAAAAVSSSSSLSPR